MYICIFVGPENEAEGPGQQQKRRNEEFIKVFKKCEVHSRDSLPQYLVSHLLDGDAMGIKGERKNHTQQISKY
jgi:hypothetical protein